MTHPTLNLIGAGLAGSLLSVFLARRGYPVHIFERRSDPREAKAEGGRSINLALSARGIYALQKAGVLDEVMRFAIPMRGRMIHDREGQLDFQPYSQDGKEAIYSVSRSGLNQLLLDLADAHDHIHFHFEHQCEEINLSQGEIQVRDLKRDHLRIAPGKHSLACDGAYSAVRYTLQKTSRFNLVQEHLAHGYKELTIPPGEDGEFQMEPHALHIWPRGSYMMIALPNPDKSFTCTLFFPFEGPNSFAKLDDGPALRRFFEEEFPDTVPLMPDFESEFFTNPTSSLVTIRCFPWVMEDKVALLGDAAHAIVPFFGQGMNAAFEDCTVFAELLDGYEGGKIDWGVLFDRFQRARKPQAEAIADMALENFVEMRDKVADEEFLLAKQIEGQLGKLVPGYRTRYELVSFSRVPYAEAYQTGLHNHEVIERIKADSQQPDRLSAEEVGKWVQELVVAR